MEKIIFKLQSIKLLNSEIEKVWQLEKISNELKTLAEVKRKNIMHDLKTNIINTLKLTPKTATREIVANSLINIKKSDFYLYINEDINLLFYYDKEDNTINVSNEYHFSNSDYYKFNIENINKLVDQTFENNHELINN